MDSVWLLGKEILLLGDFNIDPLNVNHSNWQNITRSYNLSQCITRPTRITHSSRTLIDHIYSSNPSSLIEICIPCIGVSDHYAACVTWSKKNFKIPRRQHTSITFRSFKRFNLTAFLSDLNLSGLSNILAFRDPDEALSSWVKTYLAVVDKHIPLIQRRVKSKLKPGWLTQDILDAIKLRDFLKKER